MGIMKSKGKCKRLKPMFKLCKPETQQRDCDCFSGGKAAGAWQGLTLEVALLHLYKEEA